MSAPSPSAVPARPPQIDLKIDDNKSFIANIADCLHFSNAFSLAGFETVNDKVLKEMNERVKMQMMGEQSTEPRANSAASSPATKDAMQATLQNLARINRSPPESRFSAAHHREFAHSDSIMASSKRQGTGEESPSKRRRARGGAAIGIPNSPTRPLKALSLGRDDLERVSAERHREKQRKDQQTSPRRRLRGPPMQPSLQPSPQPALQHAPERLPRIPGSMPTVPSLQFDLPKPEATEPIKPGRPLPKTPDPSMPRSQTMRSLSHSIPRPGTRAGSNAVDAAHAGTHSGSTRSISAGSHALPHSSSHRSISASAHAIPRSSSHRSIPTIPHSSSQRNVSAGSHAPAGSHALPHSSSQRSVSAGSHGLPHSSSQRSISSSAHAIPHSGSQRSVSTIPHSSSQRSISAAARHPKSLLPPFSDNLPSYARPTQATLRRSQSIQPASTPTKDPRARSVSAQDAPRLKPR